MWPNNPDHRILIFAPVGQDAPSMAEVLNGRGFQTQVCEGAAQAIRGLEEGAGALLITEEALEKDGMCALLQRLETQAPWSEVPVIILTSGGASRQDRLLDLAADAAGSLMLLERPMAAATLVRALDVALRSRRRQYQVRDLLADQEQRRGELERSERLLRLATGGARVGLVIINQRFEYLFANEAYSEVLALPFKSIIGRRVSDVLAAGWSQIQPRLQRALAGERITYELMLPPLPGTDQPRYFSISYQPHQIGSGEPAIVAAVVDITARKHAEKALRRAKEFDEAVMNNLGEGLYTVDIHGRVTSMNPVAERLFGWTFDELRGRKMHEITHYKRRDGTPFPPEECPSLQVLRGGPPLADHEDTFIRKDGSFFDVVYSSSPLREGQTIVGVIVVFRDVTERKRGEEARARLAAIVASSEDAIVSKDLTGVIMTWNRGAEQLFGYTAEEVVGKSITIIIPPARLDEEPRILSAICRGERLDHFETIRRRKDGTLIDVELSVSPITDSRGRIVGISKIARNITARKEAELMLREHQSRLEIALATAQAASRAKDRFLASVSHELRTPLTPLLMNVSMLREEEALAPAVRNSLDLIERNIRLEAQMVNDLLDFSRIAHDRFEVNLEDCDLHQIIRRALEVCQSMATLKDITIDLELEANHHHLRADATRLQQVFWNLLQNAIKFTSSGGQIAIASRSENDHVVVTVTDTGRGIDPWLLERIFEPFEQGAHRSKETLQGLGLGLAIARRIMVAHGGTLTASSEGRNRGATFTVRLRTVCETELAT